MIYQIEARTEGYELYQIEAEDEEQALENWEDGEIVGRAITSCVPVSVIRVDDD